MVHESVFIHVYLASFRVFSVYIIPRQLELVFCVSIIWTKEPYNSHFFYVFTLQK